MSQRTKKGRESNSRSSATGNEFFEKCAEFLSVVLDSLSVDSVEEGNLKTCVYNVLNQALRLLSAFLTGNYVCFDAFRIYELPIFFDLLSKFMNALTQLQLESVFDYPNFTISVIRLLRDVCAKQLQTMLETNVEFVQFILDVCNLFMRKQLVDNNTVF